MSSGEGTEQEQADAQKARSLRFRTDPRYAWVTSGCRVALGAPAPQALPRQPEPPVRRVRSRPLPTYLAPAKPHLKVPKVVFPRADGLTSEQVRFNKAASSAAHPHWAAEVEAAATPGTKSWHRAQRRLLADQTYRNSLHLDPPKPLLALLCEANSGGASRGGRGAAQKNKGRKS